LLRVLGGCYIDGRQVPAFILGKFIPNPFRSRVWFRYTKAFIKNEALGNFPGYNPKTLMDDSRILTQTSIEIFVEQNKPNLRQNLDLPSQYLLGVRKSPTIFDK